MSEQRLKGELAIVTGSDSGIGQATAIAFAREGADVVVTYLHDRQGAEHTARDSSVLPHASRPSIRVGTGTRC